MTLDPAGSRPRARRAATFRRAQQDPVWVRWTLTGIAMLVVLVLIVIPLVNVFAEAFAEGIGVYWKNLSADPDTRHAILLTLTVVPIALAANVLFGVTAA